MKADYDRLRYIIQNDHCYTPFTPADVDGNKAADDKPEPTSRENKPKPLVKLAGASTSSASKKCARNVQPNGVDKDGAENARTKSVDEANSSVENNGDSEEDEDEETDFSDFTPSESDNDRDSDLDFSVYDSHSRRTKKVKKRKQKAAKKALQQSKKRRHSTVESALSDDASTQSRKKVAKVLKKNTSATTKSASTVTPTVTTNTLKSPVASSTPRLSKGSTPVSSTKETPPLTTTTTTVKEAPQTSAATELSLTPTIKKVTQTLNPRGATQTTPKEPIQPGNPIGVNKLPLSKEIPQKTKAIAEPTNPTILTANRTLPTISAGMQKATILVRHTLKEKPKPSPDSEKATTSVTMTLPTLDKTRKTIFVPVVMNRDKVHGSSVQVVTNPKIQRTFLPLTSSPTVSSAPIITYVNKAVIRTTNPSTKHLMDQTLTLQSEQDKQLDLINSLVQEELNKPKTESSMCLASASCNTDATMPAAIPNIVKMLETSELPSACKPNDLLGLGNDALTSNAFDPSNETQLPDDLLDGIDDPEELSDDLMRHVAKLVESDKTLRDVIDQEVLNRSNAAMASNAILTNQLMPIAPPITLPVVNDQPPPIILNTVNPIITGLSVNSPIQFVTKIITTSANTTPTASKEPIKVKRSDGRIIILPPIEAPATRGAKRRAETIVTPETQQKAKIISASVETPIKSPTESPLKKDLFRTTPKAKPVPVQDRRASVASKNSPQGSKVKRSLSISNPPQFDDLDDENDESDYSYNSEDDPHR